MTTVGKKPSYRPAEGSVHRDKQLKILLIPNTISFPPFLDELPSLVESGNQPRTWALDLEGEVDYLDQRLNTHPPVALLKLYKLLPMWAAQVLEAYRVGRRYDVVFCWSVANVALVLALLLKVTRRRFPLVALLTRVTEPKKAKLLKLVHTHLTKIILPPTTQREFAIDSLKIPSDKLVSLPWTVDTSFWKTPTDPPRRDIICAAGGEMRDYWTLVRAMEGLDIRCHIAGALDSKRDDWWNATGEEATDRARVPHNVSFGTMSPTNLRDLYARSRFVVVPLQSTSSDNGITCMNEAWSMGRAVIVSRVQGQRDAFTEGQKGLWVEQGNVQALRNAIIDLWEDPRRAEAMGETGSKYVRASRDHVVFAAGINQTLMSAATGTE